MWIESSNLSLKFPYLQFLILKIAKHFVNIVVGLVNESITGIYTCILKFSLGLNVESSQGRSTKFNLEDLVFFFSFCGLSIGSFWAFVSSHTFKFVETHHQFHHYCAIYNSDMSINVFLFRFFY